VMFTITMNASINVPPYYKSGAALPYTSILRYNRSKYSAEYYRVHGAR